MTFIGYVLDYDGTWICVYVGGSKVACMKAAYNFGPYDGSAMVWSDGPLLKVICDLTRFVG